MPQTQTLPDWTRIWRKTSTKNQNLSIKIQFGPWRSLDRQYSSFINPWIWWESPKNAVKNDKRFIKNEESMPKIWKIVKNSKLMELQSQGWGRRSAFKLGKVRCLWSEFTYLKSFLRGAHRKKSSARNMTLAQCRKMRNSLTEKKFRQNNSLVIYLFRKTVNFTKLFPKMCVSEFP